MKTRTPWNKDEFVKHANIIHERYYDYNDTLYVDSKTKIIVCCPNHGFFEITPASHLQGYGCKLCKKIKRITKQFARFSDQANTVHSKKYIYQENKFSGMTVPMEIKCPIHGYFKQRPTNHLHQKQGCPACAGIGKNTIQFIEEANKVHNNTFDYSETVYTTAHSKTTIICPKHGPFLQRPNDHLTGYGCNRCRPNAQLTHEQFLERAKKAHGQLPRYDYSLVEYKNRITPVTIICPTHGEFQQKPEAHFRGCGCPLCKMSKGESKIYGELKGLNVEFEYQKTFEGCVSSTGRVLRFDFFLPTLNLLIEYDGEQHFNEHTPKNWKFNLERTKELDAIKNRWAKENGVRLIRIPYWEHEKIETILLNIAN